MDKNDILDYVTETPGNTNRAVLGSMLNSIEGTGLPAVTSDDNGKVLTVVEGIWDKAASRGGADTLVVGMNPETGSLDKTWNEINNAFPNVYASLTNEDGIGKAQISVSASEGEYIVAILGGLDNTMAFFTDSADGYPSVGGGAAPIVDVGGKDPIII